MLRHAYNAHFRALRRTLGGSHLSANGGALQSSVRSLDSALKCSSARGRASGFVHTAAASNTELDAHLADIPTDLSQEPLPDTPYYDPSDPISPDDPDAGIRALALVEAIERDGSFILDMCSRLEQALLQADFHLVPELWWSLRRRLGPLTPSTINLRAYYKRFSNAIANLDTYPNVDDQAAHAALDDMAACAAANGYYHGASTRMHYRLQQRDTAAVFNIIACFRSVLDERQTRLWILSRHLRVNDMYHAITKNSGDRISSIPPRFSALAVAACVMAGDFSPLLPFAVLPEKTKGHTRLLPLQAEASALASELDLPKKKTATWVARYNCLCVLSIPLPQLTRYFAHMSTTRLSKSPLPYYADFILQELSEEEPYLTLDPHDTALRPRLVASEELLAIVMFELIRGGNTKAAERFWLGLSKIAGEIPPLVQAAVINGFAETKQFGRARAVSKAFLSGPSLSPRVLQAYLKALLLEGSAREALREFERFERTLQKMCDAPNDATVLDVFNTILEWLVDNSRIEEARKILDRMKLQGPKPNIASFNIFMVHQSRAKNPKAISAIMQEMATMGMIGDISTAAVLLPILHSVRSDAAPLVIAMLQQAGVTLDGDSYRELLRKTVSTGSPHAFDAAFAFIDHIYMLDPSALVPAAITIVLSQIERTAWAEPSLQARYRKMALDRFRRRGRPIETSVIHLVAVIRACYENPTRDSVIQALRYYRRFKEHATRIVSETNWRVWARTLSGLIVRGEWELAEEILHDVDHSNLSSGLHQLVERVRMRDNETPPAYDEEDAE